MDVRWAKRHNDSIFTAMQGLRLSTTLTALTMIVALSMSPATESCQIPRESRAFTADGKA